MNEVVIKIKLKIIKIKKTKKVLKKEEKKSWKK